MGDAVEINTGSNPGAMMRRVKGQLSLRRGRREERKRRVDDVNQQNSAKQKHRLVPEFIGVKGIRAKARRG
jgi:hypothetical protein